MQNQGSNKTATVSMKRVLTLSVALLFLLTGCSVGAYPIDNFQEMHYSPALRRQEMPAMSAPSTAIGYSGTGAPSIELSVDPAYDLMSQDDLALIKTNPIVLNDIASLVVE